MLLEEFLENIEQREGNKIEITKKRRWREEVEWKQHNTKPFISREHPLESYSMPKYVRVFAW
jgi:hypothetical protein